MMKINLIPNTLLSIFNKHFPLQTKNIFNKADQKPWIAPWMLTSIIAKRRLVKIEQSNKPSRFLTIYHAQAQNLLNKLTCPTGGQYYRILWTYTIESSVGNSKKIWLNINGILGV